jgi:hypothetical protein
MRDTEQSFVAESQSASDGKIRDLRFWVYLQQQVVLNDSRISS